MSSSRPHRGVKGAEQRQASFAEKRLGHTADAEPFNQIIVAKAFGGCSGHPRTKIS